MADVKSNVYSHNTVNAACRFTALLLCYGVRKWNQKWNRSDAVYTPPPSAPLSSPFFLIIIV